MTKKKENVYGGVNPDFPVDPSNFQTNLPPSNQNPPTPSMLSGSPGLGNKKIITAGRQGNR